MLFVPLFSLALYTYVFKPVEFCQCSRGCIHVYIIRLLTNLIVVPRVWPFSNSSYFLYSFSLIFIAKKKKLVERSNAKKISVKLI